MKSRVDNRRALFIPDLALFLRTSSFFTPLSHHVSEIALWKEARHYTIHYALYKPGARISKLSVFHIRAD